MGIKNQAEVVLNLYYWNIHHTNLYKQVISLSINTNFITNPNHRNDIKLQAIKESYILFGGTYFPFNKYLLSIYPVLGTLQGTENIAINSPQRRSHLAP